MSDGQAIELKTEDSPNAPNLGQVTAIQRPDYVPEKFYDSKSGVINFEAMAKSYAELERMKSAPEPKGGETTPPATTTPPTEKVVTPAQVSAIPGVDDAARKTYTDELTTAGKLSDTSYAALDKAGYSKAMVDAYVKGLQADATVTSAVAAARLADSQIQDITTSIGGQPALTNMINWAKGSLPDAELKAYNEAVSGSDPAKVKLAVHGLYAQYTKANGSEENLIRGRNEGVASLDRFESRAEQTAAINNPLYQKDPAYRARVSAKIGRSNV